MADLILGSHLEYHRRLDGLTPEKKTQSSRGGPKLRTDSPSQRSWIPTGPPCGPHG
jgi:hypothetical protein